MRHRYRLVSGTADAVRLSGLVFALAMTREEHRERVVHRVIHVASGRPHPARIPLAARGAICLALFATPSVASAQADDVATPTEMFDPERGLGLPLSGGLILYNQTRLEAQYDSNIYNVDQNRTDDTLGLVDTNFRLATRLPRHQVELQAGVGIRRYADTSDENTETYRVDGNAFLDLGGRFDVNLGGGFSRGYEMRGTSGDQFLTDRPILFDRTRLEASVERTGGILETALSGSIVRRSFKDASINGAPIDLSERDNTLRRATFRAAYRVSPPIRIYAQFGVNEVDYRQKLPFSRDSSGYSVLGGVHYEVTRLIDVEVAAGYIRQNFDAPGTKAATGLNYMLRGSWTPTPMWRFTARGGREVDASPLTDVPAIVRSDFNLSVQRALGRRMLVEARVTYIDEDYRGLDRNDRRFMGSANVQYRVTNNIAAVLEGGYRRQSGGNTGRSYSGAWVSIGLRTAL